MARKKIYTGKSEPRGLAKIRARKIKITRPYSQKTTTLDKNKMKYLVRPEWHREFRESHISRIMNSICRGTHPSETITVNYLGKSDTHRILNGNHRIEAIRRIINANPNFSIEVTFTIYKDLKKPQELEIYHKVNNTRRENGMDKIKAHIIGTDIWAMIEKNFPCRVLFRHRAKAERNCIPITYLLQSYVNRETTVGPTANIFKLIPSMGEKDYDRMFSFMQFFKRTFGEPSAPNIYSNYNLFVAFAKLYYSLVGVDLKEKELQERMTKLIRVHTSELMMFKRLDSQQECYTFIWRRIKGRKKLYNVFTKQKE